MNNICIILTSTVNVTKHTAFQIDKHERINTYLKSIMSWLKNTDLNIVVVENSGYLFEELKNEIQIYKDRFELIVFDEKEQKYDGYQMHLQSKGGLEINSIWYAFNNSKILQKSSFIIKITCRFYIKDFEIFLKNTNIENYDCLRQSYKNRCEIVGTSKNNFNLI